MPDHGYTISSPCEPNGSGELIMMGWSPQYYIASLVKIGLQVLEKIFEGFLPYMGVVAILVM